MAIYRNVQLSFWTDRKVEEDFTPEDKYFYLYLFTNPHTNLCGCYELGIRQAVRETGYNEDTVLRLIDRFENVHGVISYDKKTKEILILNWHRYNWTKSGEFMKGLDKHINKVKSDEFRSYLLDIANGIERVYRRSIDRVQTTCLQTSVTDTVTENNNITDFIKEVISYLNTVLGTKYSYKTQKTQTCIKARLNENGNFTVDDFKTVIDKKCKEWKGTEMERYLRPETLFGTKFEGYLNQNIVDGKPQQQTRPRGNSRQEQFSRLMESIQRGEQDEY